MRRLPVYFIIDCSDSMVGEPLDAVHAGFQQLIRELRKDPHALETVHVSVITFSSEARLALPLTELTDVQVPELELGPGTALGSALRLLRARIDDEVRPTTRERKGDFLPLVFLLTDGVPTDDPQASLQALEGEARTRLGSVYGIGCGEDADLGWLEGIADGVFRVDEMSEQQLKALFMWLTASVKSASVAVGAGEQGKIDLRKMPDEVVEVPKGEHRRPDGPPRVMVLSSICSQTGGHYLMRYVRGSYDRRYRPVSVHPLPKPRPRGQGTRMGSVSSELLDGVTHCGHCGNPGVGVCGSCEAMFCLPGFTAGPVTCPACSARIHLADDDRPFVISERSD